MRFCSSHRIKLFRAGLLIVLAAFSAACAEKVVTVASPDVGQNPSDVHQPAPEVSQPSPISVPDQTYRETGIAAWYGKELHGQKTASGETFDMNALTAAHRTLPLGTIIRVTNLDNFKSIKVKINDRGPFVKSRILDLSLSAAKELGFAEQGIARVKLETLEPVNASALYTVQAATFAEEENARMLKERLNKKFKSVVIVPFETNLARFYRVNVGSYQSEERAEQVASKLALEGFEPIVVRKDPAN
jgi:rare lipoprotein A